jgi:hypothetical protein
VVGLTRNAPTSGGDSVAFLSVADTQLVALDQPAEATVLERARVVERLRQTDLGRGQPVLEELATDPRFRPPAQSSPPLAAVLVEVVPPRAREVRETLGRWGDVAVYSQGEEEALLLGGLVVVGLPVLDDELVPGPRDPEVVARAGVEPLILEQDRGRTFGRPQRDHGAHVRPGHRADHEVLGRADSVGEPQDERVGHSGTAHHLAPAVLGGEHERPGHRPRRPATTADRCGRGTDPRVPAASRARPARPGRLVPGAPARCLAALVVRVACLVAGDQRRAGRLTGAPHGLREVAWRRRLRRCLADDR